MFHYNYVKVKIVIQIDSHQCIICIDNLIYQKWNTLKKKRITHEYGGQYAPCYQFVNGVSLQTAYTNKYECETKTLPLILVLRNWPKLYKLCTLLGIN